MRAMRWLLVTLLGIPLFGCVGPDLTPAPSNRERLLLFEEEIWEVPARYVPYDVGLIDVEVEACVEADGPGALWVWTELDGDARELGLPHCRDGVTRERLWVETTPPHMVIVEAEALNWGREPPSTPRSRSSAGRPRQTAFVAWAGRAFFTNVTTATTIERRRSRRRR